MNRENPVLEFLENLQSRRNLLFCFERRLTSKGFQINGHHFAKVFNMFVSGVAKYCTIPEWLQQSMLLVEQNYLHHLCTKSWQVSPTNHYLNFI